VLAPSLSFRDEKKGVGRLVFYLDGAQLTQVPKLNNVFEAMISPYYHLKRPLDLVCSSRSASRSFPLSQDDTSFP